MPGPCFKEAGIFLRICGFVWEIFFHTATGDRKFWSFHNSKSLLHCYRERLFSKYKLCQYDPLSSSQNLVWKLLPLVIAKFILLKWLRISTQAGQEFVEKTHPLSCASAQKYQPLLSLRSPWPDRLMWSHLMVRFLGWVVLCVRWKEGKTECLCVLIMPTTRGQAEM